MGGRPRPEWLGTLATWGLALGPCLLPGAAMFASSLARQTSIHTSPHVLRTVRPHPLLRDPLSVPLRPITLSLSAERFAQPPPTGQEATKLLPSPLPAPGAPTLMYLTAHPPQPGPESTFLHLWWRGRLVPPCCTSRRSVGPGPSSGSSTSRFPSQPPPREFSAVPSTQCTPRSGHVSVSCPHTTSTEGWDGSSSSSRNAL